MNMIRIARNQFEGLLGGTTSADRTGGGTEKDPTEPKVKTESQNEERSLGEAFNSLIHRNDIGPEQIIIDNSLSVDQFLVALLRHEGGTLRQQEFIKYTGWSAANVSRKLSKLEAEGLVERIRLGREKVVYLPESDPR